MSRVKTALVYRVDAPPPLTPTQDRADRRRKAKARVKLGLAPLLPPAPRPKVYGFGPTHTAWERLGKGPRRRQRMGNGR